MSVLARTHATAAPPSTPVLVGAHAGGGRVVVAADSDFVGDDSIVDLDNRELWLNLVTWAAVPNQPPVPEMKRTSVVDRPEWTALAKAVGEMRPLQDAEGAIALAHHDRARDLVAQIGAGITALAGQLPHQAEHLAATVADFQAWAGGGFGRPDFLDSLMAFHPERQRRDGLEHLVVFPMYTQNGNPDRNVEALVVRTVWPDWIAALESSTYSNPAFVPIEFAGFTAGYDTHSAVLFPETVATRETVRFTWGAIFCDREAARYRRVTHAAAAALGLALPPEAELLLADQTLAQEIFAFWDLVHDRTHARGELPFDPFMIRQRMPYWMYALEELRCVDSAVVELCGEIENLYRAGINRSRLGHWLAAHTFVAGLVPPHPASTWVQGGTALPTEAPAAVALVLDDEFPLSVFYEALRRRLGPVI